jgi:hypothetical protein
MKLRPRLAPLNTVASVLAILFSLPVAHSQTASQTITLIPGWNAIWVEVGSVYPAGHPKEGQAKAPSEFFGDSLSPAEAEKILIVTSPKPLAGTAEFFAEDPASVSTFNQDEWEQWHNPQLPGDNLTIMGGNRPYLIRTSGRISFTIEGKVRFQRPSWNPDRYNLIGFGLDGSPTFHDFFAASGATHPTNRIYRLNPATGNWTLLSSPLTDTMRPNEAYWIFSAGPSDYMGPVSVDFDTAVVGRMSFAGPADAVPVGSGPDEIQVDLEEIVFSNMSGPGGLTAIPELDLITPDPNSGSLNLRVVNPGSDGLSRVLGNQVDSTPGASPFPSALGEAIAPGTTKTLTLGALREWSSGLVGRMNVYRLQPGGGAAFWLPVSAQRNDILLPTDLIPETPEAAVGGLWVGEVVVTAVTSLVENGGPLREAAAPAPLRILLHSDSQGIVRLLSQVTVMKTRTADPAAETNPVLVIDQNQIPFFEGITERNGKKVGLRIEAVAFDLPRETSPAEQGSALLEAIVAESTSPTTRWRTGAELYKTQDSVTQAAIESYLLFRGIRPPDLRETYKKTLRCDGAIGAGKTVRTFSEGPNVFVLDGFHRSNPFRHAYHQKHPKGPTITREVSITFDSESANPDRLSGIYEERITGLIKSSLTLKGTINMQLVSTVSALAGAQ